MSSLPLSTVWADSRSPKNIYCISKEEKGGREGRERREDAWDDNGVTQAKLGLDVLGFEDLKKVRLMGLEM